MQNEWPFNFTSSTSCKCTTQAIHSSHPCCNICISHVCHDLKRATWPHRVSWFSWRAGCHTTAMKWSILHNQVPKHKKRLANQKPRSATFTTCGANGWNGGSPFHGARGEKNGCSWNSCAVFSMRQALIIPWRILWVPLETNWPCILNESQLWIPLNPF